MGLLRSCRAALVAALMTLATVVPSVSRADDRPVADPFPAAKRAALSAALDRAFKQTRAPGAIVGVWIPGEGSFVATRGFADEKGRRPMRVDDHVRIGSITKTFTATLLLILADDKKLGLDDPVSKYAPWVPNGANITLRMLADMTAGLHSYTEDDAWVNRAFADTKRAWTARELVDVGLASPPDFAPGRGWHYSNTNYVLLGMILAQVSGKPLGDALAEKIFVPLRLTQTSWPTTGAMPAPFARGVTMQSASGKRDDATHRDPNWAQGAGQLISTLSDLRTWVVAYTTGTLLSPAMQRERLAWMTMPPNTPERAYGIGIGHFGRWLGHTGELPGYNTTGYYLPGKQAVIVVSVNSDIAVGKENPAPLITRALAAIIAPDDPMP